MTQEATEARNPNIEVSRTTITYSMLHPTALDPASMSDVDIANHMSAGEFLGERTGVETVPVAPEDVDAEVERRGAASGFFADGRGPFGS